MTKKKNNGIETIIGKDTIVTGNINLTGNILVYGKINGDISTNGTITLATTAQIHGQLTGEDLNIGGTVEGNVQALDKFILGEKATLNGDIKAAKIVIEDGARFEGSCFMNMDNTSK